MNSLSNPKKMAKRFAKVFLLAFLIMVAISHKQIIEQIFDYNELYFKTAEIKTSEQKQEPIEINESEIIFPYSEKNNFIEIPSINIEAPIVFSENADPEDLEKLLDEGVVHFPKSVLPLENGTTILLGHSAPFGWPKIKHDWVFSDVVKLEKGDEIIIYFDNKKITYYVTDTIFLEKGEEIPEKDLTNSQNYLIIISCWPPGKDSKRIAIMSELTINQ